MSYHIGLVKAGKTVVVECAQSVDQLSCEVWLYFGERETTIEQLRKNSHQLVKQLNKEHGTAFVCARIKYIDPQDFTAGHAETIRHEFDEDQDRGESWRLNS